MAIASPFTKAIAATSPTVTTFSKASAASRNAKII